MDKLKKDATLTLERYPKLALTERPGKLPSLTGQIDIVAEDGSIIETFTLRIQYTENFPNAYPLAYETGGRFLKTNPDLHVNADGTLCLNVEQDEILETRNGITTIDFIQNVLIPNLAWRVCKLEGLTTDLKEHRHGVAGIVDSYKEKLGTDNIKLLLVLIGKAALNQLPDRNEPCLCGSRKKYKQCHYQAIESIRLINRDILTKHFKAIKAALDE